MRPTETNTSGSRECLLPHTCPPPLILLFPEKKEGTEVWRKRKLKCQSNKSWHITRAEFGIPLLATGGLRPALTECLWTINVEPQLHVCSPSCQLKLEVFKSTFPPHSFNSDTNHISKLNFLKTRWEYKVWLFFPSSMYYHFSRHEWMGVTRASINGCNLQKEL